MTPLRYQELQSTVLLTLADAITKMQADRAAIITAFDSE